MYMVNKTEKEKIMGTNETEVIAQLEEYTTKEKMSLLYRDDFLNKYLPIGDDTKKPHDDVIAKYLLNHLNLFSNDYIPRIDRKGCYIQESHRQLASEKKGFAEKNEKYLAQNLYGLIFDGIGEIIDFETPISDGSFGEVDLLGYNENGGDGVLSLIELKREDSPETILRAILEICTYFLQIDIEKLKEELKEKGFDVKKVRKVVLTFKGNDQLERFKKPDCIVHELAEKLKVDVLALEKKGSEYKLTTP
jgi:uncharacterized protein (UPF0335 family)